jgi:hypothetical protein
MENSLYYTFSAIPQVLAAFIALSGVFLIFKIQEFKVSRDGRELFKPICFGGSRDGRVHSSRSGK